jgi:hypothetical protein
MSVHQLSVDKKTQPVDALGGGGDNGDMEARVAKLEVSVSYIERDITDIKSDIREIKKDAREDFRILAGLLIAVAVGLAGLMSKGFHWI